MEVEYGLEWRWEESFGGQLGELMSCLMKIVAWAESHQSVDNGLWIRIQWHQRRGWIRRREWCCFVGQNRCHGSAREFHFSGRLEVWRVSFARATRRDVVFILCHRGHGLIKVEEWTVLGGGFLRLFNAVVFVAENGVYFVWGEYGQCRVHTTCWRRRNICDGGV